LQKELKKVMILHSFLLFLSEKVKKMQETQREQPFLI